MIVVMKPGASGDNVQHVVDLVHEYGLKEHVIIGTDRTVVACVGDKRYGILSVMLAAAGKAEIIRILPASVFWPAPKVESAMVQFKRDEQKAGRIKDMKIFRDLLGLFMGHRRKMLKACTKFAEGRLKEVKDWPAVFEKCGVDGKLRAEKLSAEDYISLANACCI